MPSVPNSGSSAPPPPLPVWNDRPPDATVRYAGFWIRVGAAIVDGIVLWVVWWIILMVLPTQPMPPLPENPDLETLLAYLDDLVSARELILYALVIWAYFAFQESSSAQATLGKRMLGIRVSTDTGGRLSLAAASLRAWPVYLPTVASLGGTGLSSLGGLVALVACVAVAFSARKQGLHDKMARAVLTRR